MMYFITITKLWVTLYQQVVRMFGDGYKGSLELNGTYDAALGVFWGYSWRSVGFFGDGGGIGMVDGGDGDRLYKWIEMQKQMLVLMSVFG